MRGEKEDRSLTSPLYPTATLLFSSGALAHERLEKVCVSQGKRQGDGKERRRDWLSDSFLKSKESIMKNKKK